MPAITCDLPLRIPLSCLGVFSLSGYITFSFFHKMRMQNLSQNVKLAEIFRSMLTLEKRGSDNPNLTFEELQHSMIKVLKYHMSGDEVSLHSHL